MAVHVVIEARFEGAFWPGSSKEFRDPGAKEKDKPPC